MRWSNDRTVSRDQEKKKARLNAKLLQNRARRVVANKLQQGCETELKVVEWVKEILPNKTYQDSYEHIKKLFETNERFHRDAREATRLVLSGKLKPEIDAEVAIDEAVHYLLKELAFVLVSPKLFKASKVAYIYHKNWPIFENLINGVYNEDVRENLGFVIINDN